MTRIHIHLDVENLDKSVAYYTAMFGVGPHVLKDDYAKWSLDDPSLNLALSTHAAETPCGHSGVSHLGIEAPTESKLRTLYDRADNAAARLEEGHTTCCYARSEKSWSTDPDGVKWELFHTYGDSETYYAPEPQRGPCCAG